MRQLLEKTAVYSIPSLLFLLIFTFVLALGLKFERNNQKAALEATQQTGVYGTKCSVTLPDGRVVVAGVIMDAQESQRYFCEYDEKEGNVHIKRVSSSLSVNGKPFVLNVLGRGYIDPDRLKQKK